VEVHYDQERVLAFDYEAICQNYDIDLQTMRERIRVHTSKGLTTKTIEEDESAR